MSALPSTGSQTRLFLFPLTQAKISFSNAIYNGPGHGHTEERTTYDDALPSTGSQARLFLFPLAQANISFSNAIYNGPGHGHTEERTRYDDRGNDDVGAGGSSRGRPGDGDGDVGSAPTCPLTRAPHNTSSRARLGSFSTDQQRSSSSTARATKPTDSSLSTVVGTCSVGSSTAGISSAAVTNSTTASSSSGSSDSREGNTSSRASTHRNSVVVTNGNSNSSPGNSSAGISSAGRDSSSSTAAATGSSSATAQQQAAAGSSTSSTPTAASSNTNTVTDSATVGGSSSSSSRSAISSGHQHDDLSGSEPGNSDGDQRVQPDRASVRPENSRGTSTGSSTTTVMSQQQVHLVGLSLGQQRSRTGPSTRHSRARASGVELNAWVLVRHRSGGRSKSRA